MQKYVTENRGVRIGENIVSALLFLPVVYQYHMYVDLLEERCFSPIALLWAAVCVFVLVLVASGSLLVTVVCFPYFQDGSVATMLKFVGVALLQVFLLLLNHLETFAVNGLGLGGVTLLSASLLWWAGRYTPIRPNSKWLAFGICCFLTVSLILVFLSPCLYELIR